jgi:hypothetical protein
MMNSFAQFLPSLLQRIPDKPELLESLVFAVWTNAVGEGLDRRTRLLNFQHGRLTVAVPSAIWKRELISNQVEILLRLDKQLGQRLVKSLAFKIDPSLEKEDLSRSLAGEAPNRVSPDWSMSGIEDLELRKALASAASQYLSRQSQVRWTKAKTSGR